MGASSSVRCAEANHLVLKTHSVTFLADAMLGSTARKLRIFGFDTLYIPQADDKDILKIGIEQDRVILTADKDLFKRILKVGARGVFIPSGIDDFEELAHIFGEVGIRAVDMNSIGSRCSLCNGLLEQRTSDQVKYISNNGEKGAIMVPDKVVAWHNQFFQCTRCGKMYWEGSHLENIKSLARNLDAELMGRSTTTSIT
jgi:uncharacterized protein